MGSPDDTVKEMAFDDLNAGDKVLLGTKNSRYEFEILDPVEKRGLLAGGSLGDRQRAAVMMGTLAENTKSFASDSPIVKLGDRVLFALVDTGEPETFFTTGIRQLIVVRRREQRRATRVTARL